MIRKLLESSASEEWWGIDFDGTLATYDDWKGPGHVGDPIQKSIEFVKGLLKDGKKVKIFTARVANPEEEDEAREAIRKFCKEHFGRTFPITNEKDPHMIGLLDDKLDMKRVKQNTGELIEREVYLGNYSSFDGVKAVLSDFKDQQGYHTHQRHQMLYGERWRFPTNGNTVIWWDSPTEEAKDAVSRYLEKRGYSPVKHSVIINPSHRDSEYKRLIDVAHGRDT